MIDVEIRFDATEIERKLDEIHANGAMVIKKAVNETARRAKKELAINAKKRYTVKKGKFAGEMQLKSATVSNLTAEITASTPPIPLLEGDESGAKANFKVSRGKRAIKAQILKEGSLKEIKISNIKAFVNNIADKNQVREKDTAKGKAGSRVIHIAMAQREGKDRLHINEKYGPSLAAMLSGTYKAQETTIRNDLKDALDKHIASLLEG